MITFAIDGFICKDVESGIDHIGDDEALSTNELVEVMCEAMGAKTRIWHVSRGAMEFFRIADKCNIIDKPKQRSLHPRITLCGGGIIFLLGVWFYTAFYGFHYPWFLAGLTAIGEVSFADDIRLIPKILVRHIANTHTS